MNKEPNNAVAPYAPTPYAPAPAAGPYGGIVPVSYYDYNPNAFHVQSGLNGYLVPQLPSSAVEADAAQPELNQLLNPLTNSIGTAIDNIIPDSSRRISLLARRSLAFIGNLLGVTLFGGGITTALCYFTPLCTISFALPFIGLRSRVKKVAESMHFGEVQTNQLMHATDLVESAIRKLQSLQQSGELKAAMEKFEPEATIVESEANVVEKETAAAVLADST